MLARLFQRWRAARERQQADAADLLRWLGPDGHAYAEARSRARSCRAKRDWRGDRHWSRVAVLIAREMAYVIGEQVADRYATTAATERETAPDRRPDRRRREILTGLVDISAGIADLAHGRQATAQAVCALIWQLQELRPDPVVLEAGRELRAAVETLAAEPDESAAALSISVYPLRAELAGQALQRFRTALEASR